MQWQQKELHCSGEYQSTKTVPWPISEVEGTKENIRSDKLKFADRKTECENRTTEKNTNTKEVKREKSQMTIMVKETWGYVERDKSKKDKEQKDNGGSRHNFDILTSWENQRINTNRRSERKAMVQEESDEFTKKVKEKKDEIKSHAQHSRPPDMRGDTVNTKYQGLQIRKTNLRTGKRSAMMSGVWAAKAA